MLDAISPSPSPTPSPEAAPSNFLPVHYLFSSISILFVVCSLFLFSKSVQYQLQCKLCRLFSYIRSRAFSSLSSFYYTSSWCNMFHIATPHHPCIDLSLSPLPDFPLSVSLCLSMSLSLCLSLHNRLNVSLPVTHLSKPIHVSRITRRRFPTTKFILISSPSIC